MELLQVNVFPYPIVYAGKDTTIKAGSSVFLQPLLSVDVTSVLWSPSSTLSCSTCISPVATPYNTTSYRIVASNAGNCLAFDDIKITILCDRNNIFIPNAFTPNADNLNDRFFVLGPGLQAIKSLRVYNRWGHLVFERQYFDANNGSLGWDGTFKGQKEPPGIYSYTAEIICGDGGIYSVNGSVTLIR